MTDIVQVVFENRYKPGTFGGKGYTYRTKTPLEVGDVVTVPTHSGSGMACVIRVNVREDEIGCKPEALRTIEAPATVGGELFDEFFN